MTSVPSFTSFPELNLPRKPGRAGRDRDGIEAGPSRHSSSRRRAKDSGKRRRRGSLEDGQEVEDGQESRHQSEYRRRDKKRQREDENGLQYEPATERSKQQDENRRKSHRDDIERDRNHKSDKHQFREERDGHETRHREAKKDRGYRDEIKEKEEKERKREKERAEALDLIRGDVKVKVVKREEDGVPWYESASGHARLERVHTQHSSEYHVSLPSFEDNEGFVDEQSNGTTSYVDTTGDRDALRYNLSSSHNPPRYKRDGGGKVLGLNEGIRIVFSKDRSEKGVEISPLGRPYIPRYTKHSVEENQGRFFLLPSTENSFDHTANFILVSAPRQSDDSDIPAYRAITRQPNEGDDTELIDKELEGLSTKEDQIRQRIIETERHLADHPEDIKAWIRYSTLRHGTTQNKHSNSDPVDISQLPITRANAEITLSILDKALDAHPNNMRSTELHIAYLRAAEVFWSPAQITERWKNVIRALGEANEQMEEGSDVDMMMLWLGYIDWREGQGFSKDDSGERGGVDEVIEVFIECLEYLRFEWWTCLFLKLSGYTERATAIFQAMMEITFFKPDYLRPSFDADLTWFRRLSSEFETFWDTEAPRIGEPGAVGWRNTSSGIAPPSTNTFPSQSQSSDSLERWLEAERQAESVFSLPGRASNLDDEEDPFRVVLFSDIQPFLTFIRTPSARLQLIYAYLSFLGLPFTPSDVPSSAPSNLDPKLNWSILHNDALRTSFWPPRQTNIRRLPWQTVGGEPMEPETRSPLEIPFPCPVRCWTQGRETMFAPTHDWFRILDNSGVQHINFEVAKRTMELLRPQIPDPSFTQAMFALEAAISPKSAVKTAKNVLSQDRDNLMLWDGYARLEYQRGNLPSARSVYITALRAALQRTGEVDQDDVLDLWASWAELEFDSNCKERCLHVICMSVNPNDEVLASYARSSDTSISAPSSINMLKTRQYLSSYSPSSQSHLILSTLFAYHTDGIDNVIKIVMQYMETLPQGGAEVESAVQFLCKILHVHRSRLPTPASVLRDILENAIVMFPNNTQFLSLYLYGEMGGRVYGRVQNLIGQMLTSNESVIGYLWAVWAEGILGSRTLWDKGGGERVRLVLDKAVNSQVGRHCVALWRLYIDFEALKGRGSNAKSLCTRAVAINGGCKELYLLPFSPLLRPLFTTRELKQWAELMVERGIRVRIPPEEYWEQDESEMDMLPEDEELQDDELGFLRERQELKPY
ncbi:hypothetical protein TREMEDRAFT_26535 [Tremella mesenterica DSM 1558]|uniref:uncharacterized protein n=1 Tax=Tremella mesenterica (strain ATCC 24925 / CBS 8224 / DSM 1558 / NBRC 9311 / NRRL Y-6157 / RJB 2259-6 / UBC 559-6) TaxID=578456 RepID=UPI0003F4A430|nr:uncharacterized protein TREMEDRAFT_26535 [Tremella mesenterica DSM 1558]EIW72388.1 hypothetical protein TREMEDRAFT_26535 [Tremella mesenterica DSM 1558]